MCDKLVKTNLLEEEIPKYVYKRVQKVKEGKYVTPVMGESLQLNVWKKATDRSKIANTFRGVNPLVRYIKRPYKSSPWSTSSAYTKHHDGFWGSFKKEKDARKADLISNFYTTKDELFPTIIVKCEVKGTVHASTYGFHKHDTYLSTHLKVVEELSTVTDAAN